MGRKKYICIYKYRCVFVSFLKDLIVRVKLPLKVIYGNHKEQKRILKGINSEKIIGRERQRRKVDNTN